MVHTEPHILRIFYQQYLVLFTVVLRYSTFPQTDFSEWRGPLIITQNLENASLVSENEVFVYFRYEITHRDAIWFLLTSVFRVRYGARELRSLRKFRVNLDDRRKPRPYGYIFAWRPSFGQLWFRPDCYSIRTFCSYSSGATAVVN